MTTLEALRASYHEAAKKTHLATINGNPNDAHTWIAVAECVARQCLEMFGEYPDQLADAD